MPGSSTGWWETGSFEGQTRDAEEIHEWAVAQTAALGPLQGDTLDFEARFGQGWPAEYKRQKDALLMLMEEWYSHKDSRYAERFMERVVWPTTYAFFTFHRLAKDKSRGFDQRYFQRCGMPLFSQFGRDIFDHQRPWAVIESRVYRSIIANLYAWRLTRPETHLSWLHCSRDEQQFTRRTSQLVTGKFFAAEHMRTHRQAVPEDDEEW